ncbi:ribonuclease T2 [Sparassis latifolia]|uniref:ribonuclease T2 n=1 Tax=Sparassis crispa TaxID=139825 RepID=A0A401G695_9APHY|nr:Ribonuclease T2 [Sparassis crispa]GBE77679.1 Ribonuclease T2 [Sparassis crispa]
MRRGNRLAFVDAMAAFVILAALLTLQARAFNPFLLQLTVPDTYPNISACVGLPSVYSCENSTAIQNTCCSPTPGGLVLQTQYWDTYTGLESEGQLLPIDSWTIHGLWPDNCDGSYEQYCDFSRQYDPYPSPSVLPNGTIVPPWTGPSVASFLIEFGRLDLLDYMNKYWINQGYPNWQFWAHEFSKHATCTSTFDVACYGPDYQPHQDVVDFYLAVIRAFQRYPTYTMLAAAGIYPSNTTTYSLASIQSALYSQTGGVPYLGCGGKNGTILEEVWYYSHVLGTEQFGNFKPLNTTDESSCNSTQGIWYYERTTGAEREVRLLA